jgi:hypothetical protein
MRAYLLALSMILLLYPAIAAWSATDTDGDGIPDDWDNCSQLPNADAFCDDDRDGYGNMCDCDFNNDMVCGGPDFGPFVAAFGTSGTAAGEDMNCDGIVGGPDFGQFVPLFSGPPGPRGQYCSDGYCSDVYFHTITIDGINDFSTTDEMFGTVTTSYFAYVAWDYTYLYIGMEGTSIGGSDATQYVLIYLDAGATITTTNGMGYETQRAVLPFGASYHFAWRADNSSTRAYETDGNDWHEDSAWDFTGDVFQTGTYVELRIHLEDIGVAWPESLDLHISMVDSDDDWTWAALPADSFIESPAGSGGSNDPDYGRYYSFSIGGSTVPNAHVSQ